jgi:soluble lytic murein transglycosylase-like protein
VSAQALSGVPAGELALMQRVQQLQALIESTRQVAAGMPASALSGVQGSASPSSGSDFASALQAATTASSSPEGYAVGITDPTALGASGVPDYQGGAGATDVAYAPLSQGSTVGGEGEGGSYEALIDQAAARNGLDPAVLHGLIQQESGFDPSATSAAGAAGLTQLMPGTASSLGVSNPLDPAESIEGGARYLGEMMGQFGGNTADALAAYNAGPGAVKQYGGVPPYAETESYVTKVLGYAEAYRQSHPDTTGAML